MSRAIRTLYRLCLRQAVELQRQGISLEFRKPIDKQAWPMGQASMRWTTPSPAYNIDAFRTLLPWVTGVEQGIFTPGEVRELIRYQFRHPAPAERPETEYIDRAITTLRVLGDQIYMAHCSSSCESEGVVIEATAAYLGYENELDPMADSDADSSIYTYRVRVANNSDKTVMVLARHWVVTDSAGRRVEVPRWASGLVGMRPTLEPGKAFEYYSKTDVETRDGMMEGAFQVGELGDAGPRPVRLFEARIAPFKLLQPKGT